MAKLGHQQVPPAVDATDATNREDPTRGLRESGGDDLTMGAVADGQFLKRDGTALIGADAGGAADALSTTGADVDVAAAPPPTAGQTLKATDATHATWQTPAAAEALATTGAAVDVVAAAPPTAGQLLKADDATHATWQAPDAAAALATAGAAVDVAAAGAPVAGQTLKAVDATHATWQSVGTGFGEVGDEMPDVIRAGDVASHDSATPLVVSQFALDPTEYLIDGCTRSLVFRVVAANGGGVAQTRARLYKLSGVPGYIGAFVQFTSASVTKQEVTLSIGSGEGFVPDSPQLYEVHIWVVSPDEVDDTIELGSAELRMINTIDSLPLGGAGEKLINTLRAGDANSSAALKIVCQLVLDPSEYTLAGATKSLVFRATASNGGGIAETKARLYNLSDAEYVGAGVTFTSATPTMQEETLTIGSGAGEVENTDKTYEVHIWAVSPGAGETIELGSAELRFVNTID